MAKRVCCLYRVSTLKQVEKDDIPMQKQRCHEFAAQMGWDIVREFSEKGVSGFKVSAKQRDAIQEIQREAALNAYFGRIMARMPPEQIDQMYALRGVLLDAIEAENDAMQKKISAQKQGGPVDDENI